MLVEDGACSSIEAVISALHQHLPVTMAGGPAEAYQVFLESENDRGNIAAAA